MNAERLHALARELRDELEQGNVPKLMSDLVEALNEVVQQPQQAEPQQRLSEFRNQLRDVLTAAPSNDFSPAWRQHLAELDLGRLLGNELLEQIETVFSRNEITPAAAAEELQPLSQEVGRLQQDLEQLTDGLAGIGIGREELAPGQFELGVLIPRGSVDNELGRLGTEFRQLRKILLPFYELATGSRPEPEVRAIASSDFSAFLAADPAVAACVAVAVERVIKLYKTILEIRTLRQGLVEQDLPEEALEPIKDFVEDRMEQGLDELADDLRDEFRAEQDARGNELLQEIRGSLRAIANRIDDGFNFEVRHEPLPEPDDDEEGEGGTEGRPGGDYGNIVRERLDGLRWMNLSGSRILELPEGESDGSDEPAN